MPCKLVQMKFMGSNLGQGELEVRNTSIALLRNMYTLSLSFLVLKAPPLFLPGIDTLHLFHAALFFAPLHPFPFQL